MYDLLKVTKNGIVIYVIADGTDSELLALITDFLTKLHQLGYDTYGLMEQILEFYDDYNLLVFWDEEYTTLANDVLVDLDKGKTYVIDNTLELNL